MVDDLDDTIRDAIAKGDIATVFKRERGNFVSNRITGGGKTKIRKKKQDKIMRTKRENKDNKGILREFNAPRYIWKFAERWMVAKKGGKLEEFWEQERDAMVRYDEEQSNGRRLTTPAPQTHTGKTSEPKPSRDQLTGEPSKFGTTSGAPHATAGPPAFQPTREEGTTPKLPASKARESPDPKSLPAANTLSFSKGLATPTAPIRPSSTRPRSPEPVAGPSKPRT